MWIELIVIACLHSTPADCREFNFQFSDETSLNGCMTQAQPYLARWSNSHPRWRIRRWKCAYGRTGEQRI